MTDRTKLVLMLPWPDMSLMPNRKNGRHWLSSHGAKVKARRDGSVVALAEMGRAKLHHSGRVPIRITFMSPDNRARDIDNLLACIKPQLDGIAKAINVDDKYFRPMVLDEGVDPERRGYLKIELGEA
ncbi:hypothetical protein [Alcaligenes endophyticus]|uniref:Uncharacterized protein n=1 Tax=Alcaligenes endophyticus TaxID=1929088 RepID=A0ABT8ENK0_9BURK|nr:hypothetical protein [Alcaligenes endophyticus]MCX5592811.1 hypothetical protein [Alcaligenes endophyticus]MDN4122853.1 hypothetical protein [Alcaligenes endophyticus]